MFKFYKIYSEIYLDYRGSTHKLTYFSILDRHIKIGKNGKDNIIPYNSKHEIEVDGRNLWEVSERKADYYRKYKNKKRKTILEAKLKELWLQTT